MFPKGRRCSPGRPHTLTTFGHRLTIYPAVINTPRIAGVPSTREEEMGYQKETWEIHIMHLPARAKQCDLLRCEADGLYWKKNAFLSVTNSQGWCGEIFTTWVTKSQGDEVRLDSPRLRYSPMFGSIKRVTMKYEYCIIRYSGQVPRKHSTSQNYAHYSTEMVEYAGQTPPSSVVSSCSSVPA